MSDKRKSRTARPQTARFQSRGRSSRKASDVLSTTSINIRPGVAILGLFPNMNYSAWFALGELVDNSISSYLKNKSRLRRQEGKDYSLRVVIEISNADQGSIRVWDNAA